MSLSPSTFLNPLTPLRTAADGARIATETVDAVRGTVQQAAVQSAANTAFMAGKTSLFGPITAWLLPDLPELPSMPDLPGSLGKAGDDINKLANKALLGEAILVGGIVATAGIAAWYFSKKEDAPGIGTLLKLLGRGG